MLLLILLSLITGQRCEQAINFCENNPCTNGGFCTVAGSTPPGFICICPQGYSGSTCSDHILTCDSFPCYNDGVCNLDMEGLPRCTCLPGYTGPHCQEHVGSPTSSPPPLQGPWEHCPHLECRRKFQDGVCDTQCNNRACLYDGFDCTVTRTCNPVYDQYCLDHFANSNCDKGCDTAGCGWDGGDCFRNESPRGTLILLLSYSSPVLQRIYIISLLRFLSIELHTVVRLARDSDGDMLFRYYEGDNPQDLFPDKLERWKYEIAEAGKSQEQSRGRETVGCVLYLEVFGSHCPLSSCIQTSDAAARFLVALIDKGKPYLPYRFLAVSHKDAEPGAVHKYARGYPPFVIRRPFFVQYLTTDKSETAVDIAAPAAECDLSKVDIVGGTYTVSDGGNIGSVVKYSCPKGMYPHPTYSRECLLDGHWKKEDIKAVCKAIQCPRPAMFEGGEFYPRNRKLFVGDVLTFECWDGFKMLGPGSHTCQENGKWSGTLTVCDNQEGECPNPGIPFGAVKIGTSYNIHNSVTYECQYGMKITGSSKRQCMENKHWSGAQPSCREWYVYDTPKEVATSISSSLSENIESSDPDKEEGVDDRKVHITQGGLMNIFILIDASKSVGKENFMTAKQSSETFIDKISSFDFEPRYAVISYASYAKPIVRLSEDESVNPDQVIEKIKKFSYKEHEDKQGTNTRAALAEVHAQLSLQKLRDPEKFTKTRNVIVLMTDGKYNMGGDPTVEIRRMRDLLDITKDREEFFDVYVFGLGDDVSITELNDIASKKDQEKHVFLMRDVDDMQKAFEDIIDETEAFQMCGLSKEKVILGGDLVEKFPWIAKISITRPGSQEKCKGFIVSKNFIMTAAHCFYIDEELHSITVDIGGGHGQKVKTLYRHPKYDPAGKSDKHVKKSFDYDLALLELQKPIEFSKKSRPICLPCTTGTSWALKQRGKSVTCSDHRKFLLSGELVKAMFIAEETQGNMEQMNVLIKQGSKRDACLADVKKTKEFENVTDITDAVTDNFLCTGGIEPEVDPQTCKGDSGGPLIVAFKKRYIQVGVISWGNINSCIGSKRRPGPVPATSRDFHTDVFHMMDWIQKVVQDDLEFL